MYPAPGGWAAAPLLKIKKVFDVIVSTAGFSVYSDLAGGSSPDYSWSRETSSGTGTCVELTGITYRKGCYLVTSPAVSNAITAIGIDVGRASLNTPVGLCNGSNVIKWEWWLQAISLTSVELRIGMMNSLVGTPTDGCWIQYNSGASSNWSVMCRSGGSTTSTVTSVAATTDWHRFTGERKYQTTSSSDMWTFYIDNIEIGQVLTNTPQNAVTLGCYVRPLTTTAKNMIIHKAHLWTDGLELLS